MITRGETLNLIKGGRNYIYTLTAARFLDAVKFVMQLNYNTHIYTHTSPHQLKDLRANLNVWINVEPPEVMFEAFNTYLPRTSLLNAYGHCGVKMGEFMDKKLQENCSWGSTDV
jgi:hypothetical protein